MLRDVFYYGDKPNVHPREKFAKSLQDARIQCTTEHFWIINEFCDYTNFDWDFDFEYLPDDQVWTEDHNNVWPSNHQKDSGTWLCNKEHSDIIVYRNDVDPIYRKNEINSNWILVDKIDKSKFDFSWHPDPTDPPYIYKWGSKFYPVQFVSVLEYHVPNATQIKYMDTTVELEPNWECIKETHEVDKSKWDMSWRPDPRDPPFIYVWGNKWIDGILEPTLQYHVPGATEIKYMPEKVEVLPQWDRWNILDATLDKHKFDFSWRPDPREPPYIYTWGNKYEEAEIKPTLEYHTPGATEIKYMPEKLEVLPQWNRWVEVEPVDKERSIKNGFDFSWRPDPREPPYIYTWGNKYEEAEIKPTLEYHVPGATEIKYMPEKVEVLPQWDRWEIIEDIVKSSFDFSWRPDPREPALIYVFGNHLYDGTIMPTVEYRMPGAVERKFISEHTIPKLAPKLEGFEFIESIDKNSFDFSWRPNPTSPPYIYVWGNQWNDPRNKVSLRYVVEDATEIKYMPERTIRKPCMDNWDIPKNINVKNFDFSWEPNPNEEPYIYEFATQWQKTGGPRYIVSGATQIKYMDILKAERVPDLDNWIVPDNIDISSFDFSWHPDDTNPPFIYHFGTQWSISGGPVYNVENATEIKYVDYPIAKALPDKTNWEIPENIDVESFDFSWHPYVEDKPYLYIFGTQWQKTGGPKYLTPGIISTTAPKYIDTRLIKAQRLPDKSKFSILNNYKIKSFDWSWHPDDTEQPYIYVFGNNLYSADIMPTIEYAVPGATEIKYVYDNVAILDADMSNWEVPDNIDCSKFDFSWKPNPKDPPYVYQFGTQWQKTGGPKYIVPGATNIKYIDITVMALPNKSKFSILNNLKIKEFDFSWHPDDTEEPYIYVFGNNWHSAEIMPTVEYVVPGAKKIKYISNVQAKLANDKTHWEIPDDINIEAFDFSWKPNPTEPAYLYQFGTQWQKTGGPIYKVEGAIEVKYVSIIKAIKLPSTSNWIVPDNIDISNFDFSWHPDDTSPPFIYHFGTQWSMSGGPIYKVEGATETKYIETQKVISLPNKTNWQYDQLLIDEDSFDFSWHPDIENDLYVYQFGTQWQKTGGPRYIPAGANESTPIKYVEVNKCKRKESKDNWAVVGNLKIADFDYSWHPDDTDQPYIYVFGNNLYPAEIMPTIEYVVSGATQIKYVNDVAATLGKDMSNWIVPVDIDVSNFDFSWKPNPKDPPYVYQFGTQWQKTGGPCYVVPEASEIKYENFSVAKHLPNKINFTILDNLKIKEFDWSWHPDDTEEPYIYVFGNQWHSAEIMPTIQYNMSGATVIKYVQDVVAILDTDTSNWIIPNNVDVDDFDFSWKPNPKEPAYIYQFGTQWQKTSGPKYTIEGATEVKYVDALKAKHKRDKSKFAILNNIKISNFDWSWHPDDTEQPYIYVFGNNLYEAEVMPTIEYRVPNATDIKYVHDTKAKLGKDMSNWIVPPNLDVSAFDFSWRPNPNDPPYLYEFNTQWQKTGGPTYLVDGATDVKYLRDKAMMLSRKDDPRWHVVLNEFVEEFDWSWHPDSTEKPYVYVFGNQWNKAETEPTIEYRVPGAIEKKYVHDIVATIAPNSNNWIIPEGVETKNFDFSWRPDPGSPPYIYQFGTLLNNNDGPIYATPKNRGEVAYLQRVEKIRHEVDASDEKPIEIKKYYIGSSLENLISEHLTEVFWALNPDIDYSTFDFEWRPNIDQVQYIHAFGFKNNISTQTYFVNGPLWSQGFREINYVESQNLELKTTVDMFFVDKGNAESTDRFNKLKGLYGDRIQKTRYLNSWVDTITRCINRSNTNLCWILNSELDYSSFNFDYYPNPWQMKMVHVFGTQWSHWGTTFMVNRETFSNDTKYIKIIEHLSNLNFVKDRKAVATNNLYDIILIDHGNKETMDVKSLLDFKSNGKSVTLVAYDESYLKTLKKSIMPIVAKKEHYVWVCSSVCDYKQFDFSYICDPFAKDNLHVFPSEKQKFGDTFLLDVNKTKELISDLEILQQYQNVNYNQHQRVNRLPAPVIISESDTHVEAIKQDFDFPYAVFVTKDNESLIASDPEPISLWTEEDKNILITSTGGTRIVVPKETKDFVTKELYDYPYIKTVSKLVDSKPLDIVYLSNGEAGAEENYEHLLNATKGLMNRVVRVDGINGRVAAYHAALGASNTPWAFTVFAKLRVNNKFDWSWQPDRLQIPKHYMFHAKNPINGLEYGHQGIIAYNKKLVLANEGKGLDFTLDDPHETVQLLSGVANFNTDEFSTWRTAFREVIKLKSDYTDISKQRLNIWLTKAEGDFADMCLAGAKDAVDFYNEVSGDIDQLKFSYEWKWLKDKYNNLHGK